MTRREEIEIEKLWIHLDSMRDKYKLKKRTTLNRRGLFILHRYGIWSLSGGGTVSLCLSVLAPPIVNFEIIAPNPKYRFDAIIH